MWSIYFLSCKKGKIYCEADARDLINQHFKCSCERFVHLKLIFEGWIGMASNQFLKLFQDKYSTTCCRPVCFRNSLGISSVVIGQNEAFIPDLDNCMHKGSYMLEFLWMTALL